jgi:hypothetical protein
MAQGYAGTYVDVDGDNWDCSWVDIYWSKRYISVGWAEVDDDGTFSTDFQVP